MRAQCECEFSQAAESVIDSLRHDCEASVDEASAAPTLDPKSLH